MRQFVLAALTASIVIGGSETGAAQRFTGRVLSVTDGDTVEVARGRGQVTIRLHGVDAPEGDQPYGTQATAALKALVLGRLVEVSIKDVDTYGRLVAELSAAGTEVGEALVRAGAAWHYAEYSDNPRLAQAERAPRAARRGLWADPRAVPPWEFRNRAKTPVPSVTAPLGPLHGNRDSKVFHAPSCQHYNCKNCTVVFQSPERARAAGFRPHHQCVR